MTNPMFQMSVDARLIRQELAKVANGKEITYGELATIIAKPVSGATSALQSARRSLLNQDGIVFDVIRGEGLIRLDDEAKVSASDRDIKRVRRAARAGAKKLASVEFFEKMPAATQVSHTAKLSALTAIAHIASDGSVKKIADNITPGRSTELPILQTLEAFTKGKN
jgi:hypothetical protein